MLLLSLAFCFNLLLPASTQIADVLLPFINAPQGVSFKADNSNYLARVYDDDTQFVLADRSSKDPFTKYYVHDVGEDLLAFECDGEGSGYFWQVVLDGDYELHCVELGSVDNLDSWNKFQSYSSNNGINVNLRSPNVGAYLKRVRDDDRDYIMPLDDYVTEFSTFWYDTGCSQPIEYEVLNVTYDTSGLDPRTYTPTIVDSVVIDNDSDMPVERMETVTYSSTRTETTTWENHFGIMLTTDIGTGLVFKLVASVEFELTLSYDYLWGGSTEKENSVEYSQSVKVVAEPHKRTSVNLVITEKEDAVVPFNALVRCTYVDDETGQVIVTETWEPGTWSGVLLYMTYITVDSEPI